MTDMPRELLRCPFCGGDDLTYTAVYSEDDPKHCIAKAVQCRDCLCQGKINNRIGWTETNQLAAEAWNIRFDSASELAKAYEAIVALTDSLTLAKGIFTHYAVLHSGKCTPDGDAKSQANMQHADAAGRIIESYNDVIKTAREQGK